MYKIIKKSKYWFFLSGLLSVLSIIFIIFFGLRLGLDFQGGTAMEYESSNPEKIKISEDVFQESNVSHYQIKESGNKSVSVKMPVLTNEEHLALNKKLAEKLGSFKETSYDTVGATISHDLISKSIWAVALASLGIIFYIAYAFRRIPKPLSSWKFGASAIIAIIHDLLITTGFVALIGHFIPWMEVDALFITALLTIMGFSVHDTIVVYDRLRENFIKNSHKDIELTTEESVNQTLARSINTSLTVIIVLLALFLLGGISIRHFVLTLIIGVFFGTYSSIFIAAAILVAWHKKSKVLAS